MANKFDFAFVLDKNIGLRYFPVSQAYATFTVTGSEDPLTLQQMRDAVHPKFVETQKKINDFIQSRNAQISRLGAKELKRTGAQLIDGGNQAIQKFLGDFKKIADDQLEAFKRQEAVKAAKIAASPNLATSTVKWMISFGWTAYQGGKAILDIWGMEGPLKIADGVKGFVDALNDILDLIGKVQDYFANEKAANTKVRAALRTVLGKRTFTEGDAKALEDAVNLYETKVLGMEMTARSLSAKIAHAISVVPREGIAPAAQAEAEQKLDGLLKGLVKLQQTLQPIQKQLKTYKLQVGAAKASAKKEKPTSWASWAASKGYEFKDAIWASWEGKFDEVKDILQEKVIDALIKKFSNPENVIAAL